MKDFDIISEDQITLMTISAPNADLARRAAIASNPGLRGSKFVVELSQRS